MAYIIETVTIVFAEADTKIFASVALNENGFVGRKTFEIDAPGIAADIEALVTKALSSVNDKIGTPVIRRDEEFRRSEIAKAEAAALEVPVEDIQG